MDGNRKNYVVLDEYARLYCITSEYDIAEFIADLVLEMGHVPQLLAVD